MFRFLFCSAFIAPIFFLPGLIGGQDASAEFTATTDTFAEMTDRKITKIDSCRDATIGVYFHDEFITTHSAEYLSEALKTASDCGLNKIRLVNIMTPDMSPDEHDLSDIQLTELMSFIKPFDIEAEIDTVDRRVEPSNLTLNGRSVLVEFDFNTSTIASLDD